MVKTIQIAQAILRDIESRHDAFFRSINKGILYFVEIREVDGWLTVDIINSPPESIILEIKKGFNIIIEKKKTPQEASNIFHSIMKASVKPKKVKCPVCGADAKLIKGNDHECVNGHKFTE